MKNKHFFEISSLIVLIMTMLSNILGVVFQSLSGHLLNSPQLYADLNAIMALFNILVLPTTVASCFISKYTAELHARDDYGKIKSVIYKAVKVLGAFALIFVIVMLIVHREISEWLNIDDPVIIILAILLSTITLFSAIFIGGLQGTKSFVLYGIFGLIGPVYKIVAIISSLFTTRKLIAILLVWIIGTLLSYIVGIIFVKKVLGKTKSEKIDFDKAKTSKYIVKLFVANAGVILLSNIDILMVKHSFDQQAGLYSAARMIGYSITYLANAFVIVLFPMVAEGTKEESEKLKLLKKTLVYNVILSILAAVCLIIFFDFGIKILLGSEYLQCKQYLIPVLVYVLPISIMNLLANYGMAKDSTRFITYSLFVCCGLALVGTFILKESLMSFIWYLGIVMWCVVLCNISYVFIKGNKQIASKG